MRKRRSADKKIGKISILITSLFVISTVALFLTVDYFSPNILKQVDRFTETFESSVDYTASSMVSPSMYRVPKLTDMGAKRLASRYVKGNMMESTLFSSNYISAHNDVIKDNAIKLETVNNSYDCFVYKITDEKTSDEWLVGVLLDGNCAGRYVLIKGEEK